MAKLDQHPQFNQVIDKLNADHDCSIVEIDSKREVAIEFDRTSSWYVGFSFKDELGAAAIEKLDPLGLSCNVREMVMRFGPHSGKTIKIYTVSGDFNSRESAAHAALSVFEALWAIPKTTWLWVTAMSVSERDTPERPDVWPPAPL